MHDRCHCDQIGVDNEEHGVGEPTHQRAPSVSPDDRVLLRSPFDRLKDPGDFRKELAPEPWTLVLVPPEGLFKVRLGLGLKQQARH